MRNRPSLLSACVAVAAAACLPSLPAGADTIRLRNGEVMQCKIVKEMDQLIKVRMPHRGRIVTTFLNRGTIDSMEKNADDSNRSMFQGEGVRNPGRGFEPVYYTGGPGVSQGAAGAPGPRPKAAPGKAGAKDKKRGVEGRNERFDSAFKDRAGGKSGQSGSAKTAGSINAPSSSSGASSPASTGTSSTSSSSFGRSAGVSTSGTTSTAN